MGIVKKQGGITTVLIYIGIAIGYLNAAILLPKFFSEEIIGLRTLIVDFASLASVLCCFGFSIVIQKFLPKYQEEYDDSPGLLFFSLLIPLFLFVGLTVLLHFNFSWVENIYADKSELFIEYFHLALLLILAQVLITVFQSQAKAYYKIIFPNLLKEVVLRVLFSINIFLYVFKVVTIQGFLTLFIAGYFLQMFALAFYLWKKGLLDMKINKALFKKHHLNEIFSFAGYSFLMGASGMLVTKIDSLMIGSYLGLKELGVYSLAIFIATIVEIPRRAITQITQPIVARLWNEGDQAELKNIYHRISISLLLIGGFLLAGLFSNIHDFYAFIPNGEKYQGGTYVVLFIGLARLTDMTFGTNSDLIMFSNKYKYNLLFIIIFSLIGILLNYLLIPQFGITGAAIASWAAVLVFNIIKFLFVKIQFKLSPFRNSNIIAGIWILVNGVTFYYIELNFFPIINILIKSVSMTFVFGTGLYFLNILPDFNHIVKAGISKLKK